ncbi:MAG: hypothetical protein ACOYMG_13945 [Candidatus Methylumidiphilus sp.]
MAWGTIVFFVELSLFLFAPLAVVALLPIDQFWKDFSIGILFVFNAVFVIFLVATPLFARAFLATNDNKVKIPFSPCFAAAGTNRIVSVLDSGDNIKRHVIFGGKLGFRSVIRTIAEERAEMMQELKFQRAKLNTVKSEEERRAQHRRLEEYRRSYPWRRTLWRPRRQYLGCRYYGTREKILECKEYLGAVGGNENRARVHRL